MNEQSKENLKGKGKTFYELVSRLGIRYKSKDCKLLLELHNISENTRKKRSPAVVTLREYRGELIKVKQSAEKGKLTKESNPKY